MVSLISYWLWHEELKLSKDDENTHFNLNRFWTIHLAITMQMLYVQKLQSLGYQQHMDAT
jgi:hypothetical protein